MEASKAKLSVFDVNADTVVGDNGELVYSGAQFRWESGERKEVRDFRGTQVDIGYEVVAGDLVA